LVAQQNDKVVRLKRERYRARIRVIRYEVGTVADVPAMERMRIPDEDADHDPRVLT